MTRYDLSRNELEETILFSVLVAGHNAMSTAKSLNGFLRCIGWKPNRNWKMNSPFECIRRWDTRCGPGTTWNGLEHALKDNGLGCFNLRARTFRLLVASGIDLTACTPQELEVFPGIAEKTSRFFILHTRKDARVAALDTHMLKYLNAVGIEAPKATPRGKKYQKLETDFIALADKAEMTVADFDLMIWNYYAGHSQDIKWVYPDKEAA